MAKKKLVKKTGRKLQGKTKSKIKTKSKLQSKVDRIKNNLSTQLKNKLNKTQTIRRLAKKINPISVDGIKVNINPDTVLTNIPKTLKKKIDEVIKLSESSPAGLADLRYLANKILNQAADISSNLKKKVSKK